MGKLIYNKGFSDEILKATLTPTINFIEKTFNSITVTFTNNSGSEATISYGLTSPPNEDTILLDSEATSDNITFSGLDDDTTFTIFVSANGTPENLVESNIVSIQVTTDEFVPPEYGVQWNQPTDTVTRLGDAIGLSAGANFTALDDDGVWKLRRCMVNDDKSINYYIDPDDPDDIGEVVNTGSYTTGDPADYTGSHGQVMVEIPKFYWKTVEPSSNVYQWWVSPIEADSSYEVHPAFITGGQTRDFIYMSAFEGTAATSTGTLRSISGVQPLAFRTLPQFRTQAQARGTGWQIQTYFAIHALQVLYLVEYADFDSQSTIGRGYVDAASGFPNNVSITTGRTIFLGNESGRESGTDGLTAISYRGVENFWGNITKSVDGLNIEGPHKAYTANESFASDTFTSPYTLQGTLASADGFVTNILFPEFLPTAVGGSNTSHLHDDYFQSAGDLSVAFGGQWNNGSSAGGFLWSLTGTSLSGRFGGSRLQIL
jgi:hypothetical protein